jgi:hypothetical protein
MKHTHGLLRSARSIVAFSSLLLGLACGSSATRPGDASDGQDTSGEVIDVDAAGDTDPVDAGESSDEVDAGPCGPGMAMIETLGICIDRYEASQAPDGSAVSLAGVLPWVNISWEWARGACLLAGKRLCTFEEWNAACAGPDHLLLPWGREAIPGRCANGGGLTEVQTTGSFPECVGWYPGIFDLIGNVAEWTATWADPVDSPEGYITRGGTIRGNDGDDCFSGSDTRFPELEYPLLGFRCCRDP